MQILRFLPMVILLACLPARAEEVVVDPDPGEIDPAEIVKKHPSMPERGTSKASVRERLGKPVREVPAVGDPPISRWVYEPFTVYFEHDRVLHSVRNDDDSDR